MRPAADPPTRSTTCSVADCDRRSAGERSVSLPLRRPGAGARSCPSRCARPAACRRARVRGARLIHGARAWQPHRWRENMQAGLARTSPTGGDPSTDDNRLRIYPVDAIPGSILRPHPVGRSRSEPDVSLNEGNQPIAVHRPGRAGAHDGPATSRCRAGNRPTGWWHGELLLQGWAVVDNAPVRTERGAAVAGFAADVVHLRPALTSSPSASTSPRAARRRRSRRPTADRRGGRGDHASKKPAARRGNAPAPRRLIALAPPRRMPTPSRAPTSPSTRPRRDPGDEAEARRGTSVGALFRYDPPIR
jgi:hypothetical protein